MDRIQRGLILPGLVALLMGGCASITQGSTEELVILSTPSGAQVRASTGWSCVTPCSVPVRRRSAFALDVELTGHQPLRVLLQPEVGKDGRLALSGNILAGGLIGLAVDSITGAGYSHLDNPLLLELQPLPVP